MAAKKLLYCLLLTAAGLTAGISFGDRNARVALPDMSGQLAVKTAITNFNGTLDVSGGAISTISGQNITIKNGIIATATGDINRFSGVYNPTGSDLLVLSGNAQCLIPAGMTVSPIFVSGSSNNLTGFPGFSGPITLADAATQLHVELVGECSVNFVLNGGTIILDNDLRLGLGAFFVGSGFVDCNGKTIHLSHQTTTWTSTLNLGNVRYVELNGKLDLSGTWTLAPAAAVTVIQGNGNVLDLSSGGTIVIPANHTLVLRDVELNGLAIGSGWLNFYDQTSTISFVGCSVLLNSSITYTQGNWYFSQSPSTIITGSNILNFIGSSTLTIDGVSIIADDIITGVNRNILPQFANANLSYKNNGRISVPGSDAARRPDDPTTRLTIDSASAVLTQNDAVSPAYKLYFRGNSAASMTLDGQGNTLFLSNIDTGIVTVAAGKTARLKNIKLIGLQSHHIALANASSSLLFGDNCYIELANNLTLQSTMTFVGSVMVNGNGNLLNLSADQGLFLDDSATVTLFNVQLSGTSVYAQSSTSRLYVADSHWMLSDNFTLTVGALSFIGDSKISGTGKTFLYNVTNFNQSFIQQYSTMSVLDGVSVGLLTTSTLMPLFSDSTSTLYMRNSLLITSTYGLTMKTGNVLLDGICTFSATGSSSATGITIDPTLNLRLLHGATFDVQGFVNL